MLLFQEGLRMAQNFGSISPEGSGPLGDRSRALRPRQGSAGEAQDARGPALPGTGRIGQYPARACRSSPGLQPLSGHQPYIHRSLIPLCALMVSLSRGAFGEEGGHRGQGPMRRSGQAGAGPLHSAWPHTPRIGEATASPPQPPPPHRRARGGTTGQRNPGRSRGSEASSGGSPHAPGVVLEKPGWVGEETPPERPRLPRLPRLAGRRHDGPASTGSGSGTAQADGRRAEGSGHVGGVVSWGGAAGQCRETVPEGALLRFSPHGGESRTGPAARDHGDSSAPAFLLQYGHSKVHGTESRNGLSGL